MDAARQTREVDQNFDYFQRKLAGFLKDHAGSYVLLKDCNEHGFFDSPGVAYRVGLDCFPDGVFSIQEVTDEPIDLGFFSHAGH